MLVDPLTGGASPTDIAAIIAGELTALAADAKTLGTRLTPGDIVSATVLASNGLTDLLEIDGLRVAAELPPTLLPGERINVQVMGMAGDRIELHILPGPTGVATTVRSARQPPTSAGARAPAPQPAAAGSTRSVASPGGAVTGGLAPSSIRGAIGPDVPPASGHAAFTPQHPSAPPALELKGIEARIAAARATSSPVARPPAATPAPGGTAAGAGGVKTGSGVPPPGGPLRPVGAAPVGAQRPVIPMRSLVVSAPPAAVPASATQVPARANLPANFQEPAALLRALRLPVTATNIALARMALDAPEKLPNALVTLERALSNTADPRITTLSTLMSFIARLDPRSPVLSTQIAAFVDHVVTGGEAKLAQFARAVGMVASVDEPSPKEASPGAGRAPATPGAGTAPPDTGTAPATPGRVAVARAALDADLKTQLLALTTDSAAQAATAEPTSLNTVLAGALTAISAVQLNAAAALAANPDGFGFTVPVALPDGYAQAHVRIDRDRAAGHESFDGDNFHIAFVLETRHLGTIGIDVMTVGRSVTVSVKTEAARAQRTFGAALNDLTARLETLRYRVVKADAVIAPPAPVAAVAKESPPAPEAPKAARLVDTDA